MELIHYITQSFLRYQIVCKVYNFIYCLITRLSLTDVEKRKIKEWEHFNINEKSLKNKKYIIYTPTLSKNLINYYLSQIYFLTIFKKLGNIPLILNPGIFKKIYDYFGFKTLEHPYHYLKSQDIKIIEIKLKILKKQKTFKKIKFQKVNCGQYAYSSTLRDYKVATLDKKNKDHLDLYYFYLKKSMIYTLVFKRLILKYNIVSGLFIDHDMCGEGEIFSLLINSNMKVYSLTSGNNDKSFIIKKYNKTNKKEHPRSLSKKTLINAKNDKISSSSINNLKKYLYNLYSSQKWEIAANTQINTKFLNKEKIKRKFQIKNNYPNVILFAHIYYDTTYSYGKNLFENYEQWLVETCKAMQHNKKINWFIKIHPANKFKIDNLTVEKEVSSIKKNIDKLPENMKIIHFNDPVNSFSYIKFMDACLTIRGTIGIEAALFDKHVITAGGSRYNKLGFTRDFNNKFEYLKYVKNLNKNKISKIKLDKFKNNFAYYTFIKKEFIPKFPLIRFEKNHKLKPKLLLKNNFYKDKKFNSDLNKFSSFIYSDEFDLLQN